MTLNLVIFDLDGVLVDACDWHKDALNSALKQTCNYVIPDHQHYTVFNGLPTKVKIQKLINFGIVPNNPDIHVKINKIKQEETIKIISDRLHVDESKVDLMEWLKSKNIKTACFTNCIRQTAELMLNKVGVLDYMALVTTNEDVENAKPSPEGYIKTLEHFEIDAKNTVIVEDSPKGIESAHASKCNVFKVKNAKDVTVENLERFINENFNTYGR